MSIIEPFMKLYIYCLLLSIFTFSFISCKEKKDDAPVKYLSEIRVLTENGKYVEALKKTDSVQILFPKAFGEIKESLALKQTIRRKLNQKQISDCDSLLNIYHVKIDSLKQLFIYRKNSDDDNGVFIHKTIADKNLNNNLLRAGINDNGSMYLESVYIGEQKHNRIELGSSNKESARSLPVNDDGLNFRFVNLGKQYEIIRVNKDTDNGLIRFIYEHNNRLLTVTLTGKNTLSYSLSDTQKKALADSYILSLYMDRYDSLRIAKDKSEILIKYLNTKDSISTEIPESIKD